MLGIHLGTHLGVEVINLTRLRPLNQDKISISLHVYLLNAPSRTVGKTDIVLSIYVVQASELFASFPTSFSISISKYILWTSWLLTSGKTQSTKSKKCKNVEERSKKKRKKRKDPGSPISLSSFSSWHRESSLPIVRYIHSGCHLHE